MEDAHISNEGIIYNILSLNYTILTMLMEYINNVISKNNHEYYKIRFNLKKKTEWSIVSIQIQGRKWRGI